jgi:predicted N-acetyltransferase YhbS
MKLGLERACTQGAKLVILVGDEPYYGRVGFRKTPEDHLILPGPVDPNRLLHLELEEGALSKAKGLVLPPRRMAQRDRE